MRHDSNSMAGHWFGSLPLLPLASFSSGRETPAHVRVLKGHSGSVMSVAFSRDGKRPTHLSRRPDLHLGLESLTPTKRTDHTERTDHATA